MALEHVNQNEELALAIIHLYFMQQCKMVLLHCITKKVLLNHNKKGIQKYMMDSFVPKKIIDKTTPTSLQDQLVFIHVSQKRLRATTNKGKTNYHTSKFETKNPN